MDRTIGRTAQGPPPRNAPPDPTGKITPDRVVLFGLLVTAALYCRDLRYSFVLDDVPLILMNNTITSWKNWTRLFRIDVFTSSSSIPLTFAKHYRPVYMLWLTANETLFGSIVPWWHLTSLLLHICVVYLVYQLARKLAGDQWTAALAALLFAFHPIHVETVSYVSASTDLLAAFFGLMSLLAYLRFRENGGAAYLAASLVSFALAMLSKESAAVFPALLIAYELLCPNAANAPHGRAKDGPRGWRRIVPVKLPARIAWTVPFCAVVAGYFLIRRALFGPDVIPGQHPNYLRIIGYVPLVTLAYLRNFVWSFRLSFYYPSELGVHWTAARACAIVLGVAIAALLWMRYRNRSGVRVQLLWAAILFVPPLSAMAIFPKEDWVHDRHMYLLSFPLCLIAAAVLVDLKLSRKMCALLSSAVLAFLLLETTVQLPAFADEASLHQNALKVAPRNSLVHRYYAFALWNYGKYDEAFREFRTVEELAPGDPYIYASYAGALAEIGRDPEAEAQYAEALRYAASGSQYRGYVLYRLGSLELKHAQFGEAAIHLREALAISPGARDYQAMLAQALGQQGSNAEARQQMHAAGTVGQKETEVRLRR